MARFRIAASRYRFGTPAANDGQFDDAEGDVNQEVAQVCDNSPGLLASAIGHRARIRPRLKPTCYLALDNNTEQ